MAKDKDAAEVLFPELDDSPEHKAIVKVAKKLAKIRADRHEALLGSKEQEDKTQQELVEKLHAAKITKFKHGGVTAEIEPRSDRVKIKIDTTDEKKKEGDDE